MKSICVSGFVGGPRSMGRVGYYLITHLLARPHYRVHFLPWKNDYMAGYWEEPIAQVVIDDPAGLEIDQAICFCSIWDARQAHFARLTTPWLFYELCTLPEEIVQDINANDHVYVTSSFVQRTFVSQGVTVPVKVLGHGVDPRYYRGFPRGREAEFVFLCVAEHTPRKNLPTLVRAFERAFQNQTDARLVLKLGLHGEGNLRECITQPHKIALLTDELEDEVELVDLYRRAHCFVLPTRAEGFGMPILEAMATGLPVIVTNYSGHLDFCTEANAFLIANKGLVDSDPQCFPYVQSRWGDPDEDHLIHLMRQVYDNYDGALAVGRRGCETVLGEWTWEKQLARVFP